MLSRGETTQYFTEKIDRGDIRDVVEATGTINAVITVQVGSQVSGTIDRLNADFNSHVKKDQIIAASILRCLREPCCRRGPIWRPRAPTLKPQRPTWRRPKPPKPSRGPTTSAPNLWPPPEW